MKGRREVEGEKGGGEGKGGISNVMHVTLQGIF